MKSVERIVFVAGMAMLSALPGCAQTDPTNVTDASYLQGNAADYLEADGDDVPAIKTSLTYRCDDNTVALVEYLADDVTAIYRGRVTDDGETLVASEPGKPFIGDNHALSGSTSKIELKKSGKESVTCTA